MALENQQFLQVNQLSMAIFSGGYAFPFLPAVPDSQEVLLKAGAAGNLQTGMGQPKR
jgi:hypothetical protein